MKTHALSALGILALLTVSATACMNELQPIQGIEKPERAPGELDKPIIADAKLNNYIKHAGRHCGGNIDCSDLVIAYLYNGQYDEALKLSTTLAKKHPKNYEVMMSHAAALELNGQFEPALVALKKGMKINPRSHKHSEWIHVKILEDRLAGGTSGSVMGFDFGDGPEPKKPSGVSDKTLEQLHFQLAERIHFIPKEDRQFGSLLNDYANLLYLEGKKDAAMKYAKMAGEYGFASNLLKPKASPAEELKPGDQEKPQPVS